MKLSNEFTVPAPVDQAFAVLLDVERVVPCLPGAALDGGDGETFTGTMKLKLGPIISQYKGTVRITESDADQHRAVLRAEAQDAGGAGTAAATITTVMHPLADGTRVAVETDLRVSGQAAQFGRGVMQDVSGKLMRQFADCLAEEMGGVGPALAEESAIAAVATTVLGYRETRVGRLPIGPAADAALAAAAGPAVRPRRSAEVLDLGAASRGAVLKRVLPASAVALAAITAVVVWRKRSS